MEKNGYVAVVGGINMDIQGKAFGSFVNADSNPGESIMSPGGVGRNIAENLVRLGVRVELVTVLGDDTLSAELAKSCGKLGIGIRGALRLSSTPASQYICLLEGGTEHPGRLVGAVAAMDAFDKLTPERLQERSGLLDGACLVYADANLPAASLAWLAERYGRGQPAPVLGRAKPFLALDPVSAAKAPRAAAITGAFDFIKPNRIEAGLLAGIEISSGKDLARAASALRSKGSADIFISLGAEGLYYEGMGPNGELVRGIVRPPVLPVANVSGAGDAASAALAWGFMLDLPITDRAALAACASALAASAAETVSEETCASRLRDLAKGATHEPVS